MIYLKAALFLKLSYSFKWKDFYFLHGRAKNITLCVSLGYQVMFGHTTHFRANL